MKNYFEKFEAQKEKLTNTLDEHHLLHTFSAKEYPITLTISQNQAPGEQMALYEQSEDGVSSKDAKLVLTFPVGEIGVRVYGSRLIIPDTLLGKIKNIGKKMRDLYLQGDYARRMDQRGGDPKQKIPESESIEEDVDEEESE